MTEATLITAPPRPDLIVPAAVSVFLGTACALLLHGRAMAFVDATDRAEAAGLAAGILGALVDRPIIHIVLLPCAVFLIYGLVQVIGYRMELKVLEQSPAEPAIAAGPLGAVQARVLEVAGRRSTIHLLRHAPRDATFGDSYAKLIAQSDPRLHRPVDFGTGALTMLGLLGTIIGLTLALQDLPAVMAPEATEEDRAVVLGSLGLAFTTTIIGIVGSLTLSLLKLMLLNLADAALATAAGIEQR